MKQLISDLNNTDRCLDEVRQQLRAVEVIVAGSDELPARRPIISLLSNAVRTFGWIENRRTRILEAIGEELPPKKR